MRIRLQQVWKLPKIPKFYQIHLQWHQNWLFPNKPIILYTYKTGTFWGRHKKLIKILLDTLKNNSIILGLAERREPIPCKIVETYNPEMVKHVGKEQEDNRAVKFRWFQLENHDSRSIHSFLSRIKSIAHCKYFDCQNYRFYLCPIFPCISTVLLAGNEGR